MKNKSRISYLLITLSLSAGANGAVSLVGVDSTAGANWRTSAALETDSEYGTAGYVVFGLNATDGTYIGNFDVSSVNVQNAYNLPAGVTISTLATPIGMWSGNGNFGTIEDPGNANAITSAPILANSGGTKQFTIARSISSDFRITLMTASGDGQGTEYIYTVNDGSGAMTSSYDHTANGLAYHVFDVSDGTSDIVIDVVSTPENRILTGIAFDAVPIPEPSSAVLLGLGMLGVSLRRRR